MEFALALVVILIVLIAYEYRFRKPDQIILYETRDGVGIRRARFYPRHFSLPLTKTTHAFTQTIEASARGNLDIRVKLAVTVAPSTDHLAVLLKVGGWATDAVVKAARELETLLLGYVKEYTELHEIEDHASGSLRDHLQKYVPRCRETLGLEIIALTIASSEPVNPQIAEAMRQREHARILEQTEKLNQEARIAAAKARVKAEEEISHLEHELELKKYDLRSAQLKKEGALASARAEQELRVKKMNLDFEKEELRLLKESPELLLLTPQAARLAEASQSMKNARTVVSLAPGDAAQGSELLGMFHSLVQKALDGFRQRKEKS